MLIPGRYRAVDDSNIWHEYSILMDVKETEKSYIFRLVELKSRYSAGHIEMLFSKSKRVVIKKNCGGHAIIAWGDEAFTFYPYQAGIPYYFVKQPES